MVSAGLSADRDSLGYFVFLFHDVERSTEIWSADTSDVFETIARLEDTTEKIVARCSGEVFKHVGDGSRCVFHRVNDAVSAALAIQREITLARDDGMSDVALRIGIHMGEAQHRSGDYHGHSLAVTSRITDAGHGGQIVTSSLVAEAVKRSDRADVQLADQGEFQLRGVRWPERLFVLTDATASSPTTGLRISGRRMDNLPTPRTSFVGRATELERLISLIEANPLVTLCGQGGVGKTRLATETALAVADHFRHGAWICEFGDVEAEGAALPAIATSLGIRGRPGVPLDQAIAEHLTDRQVLLVLDNCEHVLAPVASLVRRLLDQSPSVTILATSREPLGSSPEVVFDVKPLVGAQNGNKELDLEGLQAIPATQLLLDRASVASGNSLTANDAAAIVEICSRLDGLPLAIELAAARLRTMSPAQLLDRMDDRFEVLQARRTLSTERHRTMENAVDWSYRLLAPAEQHLFDRLSVFAGGFNVDSAREVCGYGSLSPRVVPSILANLADQSLLSVDENDRDRLRLNETMRDYGMRSLRARGEDAEVGDRFVRHWESVVESAGAGLKSDQEAFWAELLDLEFGNVRAAYGSMVSGGDSARLVRFLIPLYDFTLWRMRYEHGSWCVAALSLPDIEHDQLFSDVSALATYSLWASGLLSRAIEVSERALVLEAQNRGRRSVLLRDATSSLALYLRRTDEALRSQEEWYELAQESGEPYRIARALFTRSILSTALGEQAAGREEAEHVMRLADDVGNATMASWGHHALAQVVRRDSPSTAVRHFERSASLAAEVSNRLQRGLALRELAELHASLGDRSESLTTFRDVVRHWYRADDWANQRVTFGKLTRLFRQWQLDEPAQIAAGIVARADESIPTAARGPGHLHEAEMLRGESADRWERGHAMSHSQAYVWMDKLLGDLCAAPALPA